MPVNGRIANQVRFILDSAGRVLGYRNPVTDQDEEINLAATQALVAGDRIVGITPTCIAVSDSILAQSQDPPNSTFGATTAKGSYFDGSNVKQVGVTDLYAENPCRLKFRAAHNLVSGDEVILRALPQPHPLAYRRCRVTVLDADEVTLDGIDATGMAALTSAAAASDMIAQVDMAWGNYGPLSWMLHEAGYPFETFDAITINGATSANLVTFVAQLWPTGRTYTHGILHCGRNDSAFDAVSLGALLDYMLERCGVLLVNITYPDDNWATPAQDAAAAKIEAIAAYLYARQAANPRIRVCDLFGAFSDPTRTLQSSVDAYIGSDGVHPQANGARVAGIKMARELFGPLNPRRRTLSRIGAGSANLLTGARFTGAAGTVGSGVSGTVATGWTVGARSSANVTGGYVQVCQTPAIGRRNSTIYAAGDILDIGDGYWYVVKTGGTSNSSLPAGYASATMFDSATGVTDGTVVAFRVPKFTDSLDYVRWQFLDMRISAGGSEHISFFQSISLPGSAVEGDYVRGQAEVAEVGGWLNYATVRVSCVNSTPTQIARAHGLAPNTLLSLRPSIDMRPRTIQTPRLRVPNATATLEHRVTVSCGLEGAQVFIGLPMLEEV